MSVAKKKDQKKHGHGHNFLAQNSPSTVAGPHHSVRTKHKGKEHKQKTEPPAKPTPSATTWQKAKNTPKNSKKIAAACGGGGLFSIHLIEVTHTVIKSENRKIFSRDFEFF